MEVKNIIKSRRLELGLTMKQVADAVGVTEGAVSRWESGDVNNMRRDRIYRLSQVLDVSPLVILGIEEQVKENEDKQRERLEKYIRLFSKLNDDELEDLGRYAEFLQSKKKP